ncbi:MULTISPECIES: filamentous hemagglutinin N-terminal domain-containing protein [Nostocales]|uniref:Filamentous hemagglutinin N-terminal domain-containing protein n=3 Tax=Nostocales TaxID=1161 RepID=A0A0C1MWZ2_9CYAN|nr:filamentous hemagglutinin N-terminal domain-containing protein [Tolypothrix bouteillei]KAF3889790.1 filamentous hemagglutinin N-terminal domain-containing protein [Tolypothrix bouteillei VB521301]
MAATSAWLDIVNGILTGGMLLLLGITLTNLGCANAQVSADGTLNTTVSQTGNNHFTITNGNRVGNNLFHSFAQFSVPTGGTAIFDNTSDVQNIFSRVTGGHASNIDGLIRVNGATNLFLLNPSGIFFGPGAELNIGGSFLGTTANSIKFADNTQFSAVNPSASPLLTISVPIGLQFGQDAGPIAVKNLGHRLKVGSFVLAYDPAQNPSGLRVNPGKTLALLGNKIDFSGGVLGATNGSIELGSVELGSVGLNQTTQGWTFDFSNVENWNDIQLTQRSLLDGTGFGSSKIQLQAKNIAISGNSFVGTQNLGSLAQDRIQVNATESLKIAETSYLASITLNTGKGADISVSTRQLQLQNGGQITSSTLRSGTSGDVIIHASEFIQSNGFSSDFFTSSTISSGSLGSGKTGDIHLLTQKLSVTNSASIQTYTYGSGNGGDLYLNVSDSINLVGNNAVTSVLSSVGSSTFGTGNAGNAIVTTAKLTVDNGGTFGSLTLGAGNAGNLSVIASDSIEVRGAAPSGNVTSSLGAYGLILSSKTRALLNITTPLSGNAGTVILTTPELRVSDRGNVAVRNDGTGNAGNLEINADRVILTKQGTITAATQFGNGGNLLLNVQKTLLMRGNSKLSAEAREGGNGGNITLNAPFIVAVPKENSDIVANAVRGRGGNILVTTQGLLGLKFRPQLTSESDITASSEFGLSGTVQINTIGIAPNTAVVELPANVVDPSQQIATDCAGSQSSRFVATGRGGIPQNPNQQLSSDRTWDDTRDLSAYRKTTDVALQTPLFPELLVEATTWHRNANGELELIAPPSLTHTQKLLTCADIVKQH